MNRIEKLLKSKKNNILSIYFTAGYPLLNDTLSVIKYLTEAGADIIEIGMPFSDPIADGPVIQRSSERALANGMSVKLLFEQLREVRKVTDVPIILMGYINPVYRFGIDNFLVKCHETGIDGTIIPDLPVEEYLKAYDDKFKEQDVINIFLVSPQSTDERILFIDKHTRGFIYMVSSSSTTGSNKKISDPQINFFKRINSLNLKTPRLIGFGISDKATFTKACEYATGAIIGSAFIKALDEKTDIADSIKSFIREIRN